MKLQEPPPGVGRRLDTLGTYCPIPVIRTARAVAGMGEGEVLEVLSDDRGVLSDLPDWCLSHGHEFLGWVPQSRHYRLFLRKV